MKKNKGILTLVITLLVMIGLGYTAIWGIGTEGAGAASGIKQGLDLAGGVSITYQAVGDEAPSSEDMSDTIYKLQKRVEVYSTEAQVYQEGTDRINIEIPGVSDANTILEDLVHYILFHKQTVREMIIILIQAAVIQDIR